jgi:hypothetical protein
MVKSAPNASGPNTRFPVSLVGSFLYVEFSEDSYNASARDTYSPVELIK